MPFPDPGLTPPALNVFELNYGGVSFGGIGTGTYQLQGINPGLDTPSYISSDQQRALDHGEWQGVDLSPGRDIVVTQVCQAGTWADLETARQTLGGVMSPQQGEQPLYLQLAGGLFVCMAKPRKHNFPFDINSVLAKGTVVTSMWHATDPRWYAAPSKTASVGLPGPLGGVTFPVSFPASFGGGSYQGLLTVTNAGRMEMRPVLIFTGPLTNPRVTNLTLPGAPTVAFRIALNAGDQLIVDTDTQSVMLSTAGSMTRVPRRDVETPGNVWWNLPPGANQLAWLAASGTGTMTVQSADAWITI